MLCCLTATGIRIEAFHEINSNLKAFFVSLEKLNINVPSYLEERGKGASEKKSQACTEHLSDAGVLRVCASVCLCVCVCV